MKEIYKTIWMGAYIGQPHQQNILFGQIIRSLYFSPQKMFVITTCKISLIDLRNVSMSKSDVDCMFTFKFVKIVMQQNVSIYNSRKVSE